MLTFKVVQWLQDVLEKFCKFCIPNSHSSHSFSSHSMITAKIKYENHYLWVFLHVKASLSLFHGRHVKSWAIDVIFRELCR